MIIYLKLLVSFFIAIFIVYTINYYNEHNKVINNKPVYTYIPTSTYITKEEYNDTNKYDNDDTINNKYISYDNITYNYSCKYNQNDECINDIKYNDNSSLLNDSNEYINDNFIDSEYLTLNNDDKEEKTFNKNNEQTSKFDEVQLKDTNKCLYANNYEECVDNLPYENITDIITKYKNQHIADYSFV